MTNDELLRRLVNAGLIKEGENPLYNANHRDMVVQRIRERKDVILGTKGRQYFCQIQEKTYPCPMNVTYIEHPKPGHAVCLAALAAVKEEA